MKPNFALTLSFNGIGLLHRSPSGWLDAGAVPFDHADLPAALAQLRKTAGLLDPAPLRAVARLLHIRARPSAAGGESPLAPGLPLRLGRPRD